MQRPSLRPVQRAAARAQAGQGGRPATETRLGPLSSCVSDSLDGNAATLRPRLPAKQDVQLRVSLNHAVTQGMTDAQWPRGGDAEGCPRANRQEEAFGALLARERHSRLPKTRTGHFKATRHMSVALHTKRSDSSVRDRRKPALATTSSPSRTACPTWKTPQISLCPALQCSLQCPMAGAHYPGSASMSQAMSAAIGHVTIEHEHGGGGQSGAAAAAGGWLGQDPAE